MTELNETDIETISGAVTEGGCIPDIFPPLWPKLPDWRDVLGDGSAH